MRKKYHIIQIPSNAFSPSPPRCNFQHPNFFASEASKKTYIKPLALIMILKNGLLLLKIHMLTKLTIIQFCHECLLKFRGSAWAVAELAAVAAN